MLNKAKVFAFALASTFGAVAIVLSAIIGSAPAYATLINFDAHASTILTTGVPPASAVVTNDFASQGILFGRPGLSTGSAVVTGQTVISSPNAACGLDGNGSIVSVCTGNQYFNFVDPSDGTTPATINALSFVVGDAGNDLDSWILHVYDISDVELEARAVTSFAFISESFSYPAMHRVWIEWTGGPFGYFLDNIDFNTPTVASVPEPSTLGLIGLGLLGLGAMRRRRRDS